MPRYEFSEGSSNKFWQIDLKGKSFTTTYGKIGTAGQTTIKDFKSDGDAKKQHDGLVAEKLKKGYELVGAKAAAKGAKGAKEPKAEKPAKAAPAKPAALPTKDARRAYRTEDKFWEIWTEGSTVYTRFGRANTNGQIKLKETADVAGEVERLIAGKVKEGFIEPNAGAREAIAEATAAEKRNGKLEDAIVADPHDEDAYSVLADWLQGEGDPRGELIALQLAGKTKEADKAIAKHEAYFLGPLAPHVECYDNYTWMKPKDRKRAFSWKYGFIHAARISHNHYAESGFKGEIADVLAMLLAHPSGRFLTELTLMYNNDPSDDDLQPVIDALAKKAPATLRKLLIGDAVDQISWYNVGDLSKLWKAMPRLEDFYIEAGSFTLGTIDAPALTKAIFKTGGLAKASAKSIAKGNFPRLEHLEIYYGDDNYGGDSSLADVRPLLDRTDLKALKHLGIKDAAFADELAKVLPSAKILAQLETLDLSMGILTDEGAQTLANHADAFKHLKNLDLSENYLSDAGKKLVKKLAKNVEVGDQKDDDDPEYRYVSLGE